MTELLRTLKELHERATKEPWSLNEDNGTYNITALTRLLRNSVPQILSALERDADSEAREKKLREALREALIFVPHERRCRAIGDEHCFCWKSQAREVLKEGERS